MKPHQVGLEINYDGTCMESSAKETDGGASSASASYTVVKGDCLWIIAKRFYGSGARYMVIYDANVDVIESTAKAHGKKNSYKGSTAGWWIWPGEVLAIPEISGVESLEQEVEGGSGLGLKMAEQATAFSYTDIASGQSDSVSITLQDIGKEWMGKLMPKRGAGLGAKIVLTNWGSGEKTEVFDCGTFVLDDISFSGRPISCVLGGVSVPAMDDFNSLPKTNTWEKTTIQDIASQVAEKAGVLLHYDADTVQIAEIEQSRQTDSAFLYALCEKYGLAMKVYNRKIVIFDVARYEEKEPVAVLKEEDDGSPDGIKVLSWSVNTTIDGTYTGVKLDYTDPDKDKTISVTIGNPGRMYALNTQASSQYDAELQAAAKVNAANRGVLTMEVTIRANPQIVASHCVMLSGFGCFDGKYYVDKVKHNIGNGYTMQLSIHKVQAAINQTSAMAGGGRTYTVVRGDTLWGISKKYYGTGTKHHLIYEANAELIESAAKAHGRKDSEGGHWIWAGEMLTIPEVQA